MSQPVLAVGTTFTTLKMFMKWAQIGEVYESSKILSNAIGCKKKTCDMMMGDTQNMLLST